MDDQTRGEAPGSGVGSDAPLKRDRKALRSSKPLPTRQVQPEPAKPAQSEPHPVVPELREPEREAVIPELREPERDAVVPELREPDLSPAEQLFAGAWTPTPAAQTTTASPASAPASAPSVSDAPHAWAPSTQPAADYPEPVDADPSFDPTIGAASEPELEPAMEGEDSAAAAAGDDSARKGFLARGWRGRATAPADDEPADETVTAPAPYVPPGGFDGPGHPKLGPLVPMPQPEHRGQTVLDIAALVGAFLVPPVGFITAIIAIVRGKKVRGWASDLARTAIGVSLVMSVIFAAVGGYVAFTEIQKAEQLAAAKAEQRAHDLVVTASVPFCEVLAANPTIYGTADPDYGWPALDAPGGYNAAISAYSAVWAQLAEVAPAGIAEETAAISARVANVVNIANALGASNRAGDLLGLHEKDDLATVESWYVEYCSPAGPEAVIPAE